MDKLTSQQLIRDSKLKVELNSAFVTRLQTQLQDRAAQLTPQTAHTTKHSWWSNWIALSSIGSLGAVAAIVLLAIVPNWFQPNSPLTGYIQKGPFISGSSITIQELDKQLQPTGTSYQVTTASDFGDYRLNQKVSSEYVEVIAQGFYFNEVSGELSSAPLTLRAIADVSENRTVNVNVLTTLAAPRIRHIIIADDTDLNTAKQIAEQEVLELFQIQGQIGSDFERMNISEAGTNNAILLAASAILQGQLSVAELSELLSKLSLAIKTDGHVPDDSPLLQTLRTNADSLNVTQITDHLNQRYADLGVTATAPDFSYYIEPFISTADPLTYRIILKDRNFGVDHTPGATIKVTIFGQGFVENEEQVGLKNLYPAQQVTYMNDHTLIAEFPIDTLSAGSYTVKVQNVNTKRTGLTDGEPLEAGSVDPTATRLILHGYTPLITEVTPSLTYLSGGTLKIHGDHFAYGSFVYLNDWQVPAAAVRVSNEQLIQVDLSPALIVNAELPRNSDLTVKVQTPDFQSTETSGFQIL